MKRLFFYIGSILLFTLTLSTCVIPAPYSEEPVELKSPPRFHRESCLPYYNTSVVIDSDDPEFLTIVVEDVDLLDDIYYKIFKDYHTCIFDNAEDVDCKQTLITEGTIAPNNVELDPDDPRIYIRESEVLIKKKLFCSSANGDDSTTSHIIEVVIADGFSGTSSDLPYWRASVGGSDVWSFVVNCVQGIK